MTSSVPYDFSGEVTGQSGHSGLEPIAIVGMGCRYPGDASSPSKLWELLEAQRSAQSAVPANRFNVASWYHPNAQRPGSVSAQGGYFLGDDDGFRNFDPSFFGINPKEAATMDPQQRKLLEVVYECFESSGVTLEKLSGSQTGCYVGCFTMDFRQLQERDPEYGSHYQVTGGGLTIISNRVSYVFNLKGPSLSIDTACSSSLYALHLACQGILTGDCSAAIVGGTSIITNVEQHIDTMRLGVLSPTSTCHTFDESADGFGRGEGIGAIYIKRLSDAIAHGDPIRAIIRATAINANGKSNGINHPSVQGQEEAIRKAYDRAGLNLDQTGYVECHGTGTPVGDPLECEAIGNVFAPVRSVEEPLLIGAIKTNLGHSEGASGIAGVMKAVLSMEHGIIPATIGIKKLNPNIDLRGGRLQIVRLNTAWPKAYKYRRAGVNSFGYGGANAHVILDSVEVYFENHLAAAKSLHLRLKEETQLIHKETSFQTEPFQQPEEARKYLLVFSAHNYNTLLRNIEATRESTSQFSLPDIAYTLGVKRSMLRDFGFCVCTKSTVIENLEQSRMQFGTRAGTEPVIAFAFTGQGAQWPQMGYSLIKHFPSVRRTFQQLQDALSKLRDPPKWNLIDALGEPESSSRVLESTYSPPLCTAVQIAIVTLLRSWGIRPVAVVGHSSGEVAAAFTAGLISDSEAMAAAYYRGVSCEICRQPGAMMAVGLGADKVTPYLANQRNIVIACHNSPESITLSGGATAIVEVQKSLIASGVFTRKLNTSGNAYHSHLVKQAGQHYQDIYNGFSLEIPGRVSESPVTPMYSCITGELLNIGEAGIDYWRRNLESPVLFDKALKKLLENQPQVTHIIEIGVHSALAGPIKQIRSSLGIDARKLVYLPSLVRNENGVENLMCLGGKLLASGYPVSVERINASEIIGPPSASCINYKTRSHLIDLPPYQWSYEHLTWTEGRLSRELRFRNHPRHDLLGSSIPGSSITAPAWRNVLSLQNVPWLGDHKVGKDIIFPAAAYIAMAIESVTQIWEDLMLNFEGYTLRNLNITAALVIPEEGSVETVFNLRKLHQLASKDTSKWFDFRVSSVNIDGKWAEHAAGMIAIEESLSVYHETNLCLHGRRVPQKEKMTDQRWYAALSAIGLEFGPTFRTLSAIHTSVEKDEATAKITLQRTKASMSNESRYAVHPSVLDGCLQLSNIAAHRGKPNKIDKAFLPVMIENMVLWKSSLNPDLGTMNIRARGHHHGMRSVHGFAEIFDGQGRVMIQMKTRFSSIEGGFSKQEFRIPRQPYLRLLWKPDIKKLTMSQLQGLLKIHSDDPFKNDCLALLDELAALYILDCHHQLSKDFEFNGRPRVACYFIAWLEAEGSRLLKDPVGQLSTTERQQKIQNLEEIVSEAQLMNRLCQKIMENPSVFLQLLNGKFEDSLSDEAQEPSSIYNLAYDQLARLMELFSHQEPCLKVLEVGAGMGRATRTMLKALEGTSLQPHYAQYTYTDVSSICVEKSARRFKEFKKMDFRVLDIEIDPMRQGFEEHYYDIIVASNVLSSLNNIATPLLHCRNLLRPGGKLILIEATQDRLCTRFMLGALPKYWQERNDELQDSPFVSTAQWDTRLQESGFSGTDVIIDDLPHPQFIVNIMIATAKEIKSSSIVSGGISKSEARKLLWLVYRHKPHPLLQKIDEMAIERGYETKILLLQAAAPIMERESRVVLGVELEGPFLSRMTNDELLALKSIVKRAASAIWISDGGLLNGNNPELALIYGFANAVMTEEPSFRLSTIDVDPDQSDYLQLADFVIQQESALEQDLDNQVDNHFIVKGGIPFISRYVTDEIENARFSRQVQPDSENLQLEQRPFLPGLSLGFDQVGDIDKFYFTQSLPQDITLDDNEILLAPLIYGLSETEALILKGQHNSKYFSHECVGTVTRVGDAVTNLRPGDKAICLALGKFDSSIVAHEDLCQDLRHYHINENDDVRGVAGALIPGGTALHGLVNIGRLRKGETVLIHMSAGPLCAAAISTATVCHAKILMTFSTGNDEELLKRTFQFPESDIFNAKDASLPSRLMLATKGKGVDLILAGLGVDALASLWTCLAENGRFVVTGKQADLDWSIFDPAVFSRGATFSSFDFMDMISSNRNLATSIMRQYLEHYEEHDIREVLSTTAFNIEALAPAVQMVAGGAGYGKVILTCSPENIVPVRPIRMPLMFDPTVTFFLVGCLGGLGRSLTSWMTTRGARKFVFLSRSGADKPEAAALVEELIQSSEDISIQVVRGDVSVRTDVERAISMASSPIRGVIQAAMCLEDCLFDDMSLETFNAVINPKVQGTINLHECLLSESLDFFVMTSSIITAIGTSTQCNYSAANSFLDSMARHRRSLGLQATSIALGMIVEVGHVEEHPEVAAALKKNGMHGINEEDYLHMMELACEYQYLENRATNWDDGARSHIITGLEPGRISKSMGKTLWLEDNRLRNVKMNVFGSGADNTPQNTNATPIAHVLKDAAACGGQLAVKKAVQDLVLDRLASLVMVPKEKLVESLERPLVEFGMDSMISTEVRTWSWRELRADVPFMRLLDGGRKVEELVEMVWEAMDPGLKFGEKGC